MVDGYVPVYAYTFADVGSLFGHMDLHASGPWYADRAEIYQCVTCRSPTAVSAVSCRLPTVITRVSEYIPEVLALTERIISNGYAYESQGSVYFDTQAFKSSPKHIYGRMEPSSVSDESR